MPHIHTRPGQIDHTVSAYIVREDMDEPRVLLHMHKKHGRLLQIGGHIELDETIWGALSHEVEEESGYRFDTLEVLQPSVRIDFDDSDWVVHPVPFYVNTHDVSNDGSHFHTDSAYLLKACGEPHGKPAEGESQDLRWMSYADLVACQKTEIHTDTKLASMAALRQFYPRWQSLPTAKFTTNKSV